MRSKYLYVIAGDVIDDGARLFSVMVGTSQAESRACAWLKHFANNHGHYFERWSPCVADFLYKVVTHYPAIAPIETISPANLRGLLLAGCADIMKPAPKPTSISQLTRISLDFRVCTAVNRRRRR